MTTFKVTATHQVERQGRFFAPNEVIKGFNPEKDDDDLALVSHGLVSEVEDDKPEPKTTDKTDDKAKAASNDDKNKEQK